MAPKRTKVIHVKLTEGEWAIVDSGAKAEANTISDYVRKRLGFVATSQPISAKVFVPPLPTIFVEPMPAEVKMPEGK